MNDEIIDYYIKGITVFIGVVGLFALNVLFGFDFDEKHLNFYVLVLIYMRMK